MLAVDSRLTAVTLKNSNNNNTNGASYDAFSEFSDDMPVSSVVNEYSRPSSHCNVGETKHGPKLSQVTSAVDARSADECDHQRRAHEENPAMVSARREFHSRRFVKVKNLPPDATELDIRHLLQPLSVKDVQLNRVSETAKVTLVKPECLESFPSETRHELNKRFVVVAPSKTEGMLCVAHLPLVYTDHDFRNLVQMFGSIARCFLMRNERTGESKGYGFVEYSSKDVAYHAKGRLDGKSVGDTVLHCNWLDSSHVTYRSLHSKCVYVDHLPADYRNLIEFREVFSTIANPSYCQIAIRNGQPLGFGLVEFDSPQDTEEVQLAMNRYQMVDHKIRVTFCIPGYRAMVIYNKLTSYRGGSPPKQPLLPNPTSSYGKPSAAVGQLRNLTTQNPQIFQALQTLVKQNRLVGGNDFGLSDAEGCTPSSVHHQNPHQQQQQPPQLPQPQGNDSNVSAALILLLATQLQTEMDVQQPVFGNNQLLSMVQNVLKKQDPIAMQEQMPGQDLQSSLSMLANGMRNGHQGQTSNNASALSCNEGPNVSWKSKGSSSGNSSFYPVRKMPLLPNPPALCTTNSGLLPRPTCPPLVNGINSYNHQQQQHPTSALSYGQAPSAYQSAQSKPLFLGQNPMPFSGHASAIKSPLLGQTPAFTSNCSVPQNCHPVSMTTRTMPTNPAFQDVNFLQQLLVLAQLQQQQQHQQQEQQLTCSNMQGQVPPSNATFGQSPQSQAILAHLQMQAGGGSISDAQGTAGFVNLLQMASHRTQIRGSCPNGDSTLKQDAGMMHGPGGSSILVGNSQFGPICGIPQAIPLSLASTAGAKLPFFPSGGTTFGTLPDHGGKLNIQNGFLGPSLTSTNFGMSLRQQPPHPILVSQLVAGVQQRGSVLGDFWQFSRGAIFNNAQVLGVKRKLQVISPDHKSNGVDMQNAFLQPPCFKRRRP